MPTGMDITTDASTDGMDGARSTTHGTTRRGTADGTTHGSTRRGTADGTADGMATGTDGMADGTTHGTTRGMAAIILTILSMWAEADITPLPPNASQPTATTVRAYAGWAAEWQTATAWSTTASDAILPALRALPWTVRASATTSAITTHATTDRELRATDSRRRGTITATARGAALQAAARLEAAAGRVAQGALAEA